MWPTAATRALAHRFLALCAEGADADRDQYIELGSQLAVALDLHPEHHAPGAFWGVVERKAQVVIREPVPVVQVTAIAADLFDCAPGDLFPDVPLGVRVNGHLFPVVGVQRACDWIVLDVRADSFTEDGEVVHLIGATPDPESESHQAYLRHCMGGDR